MLPLPAVLAILIAADTPAPARHDIEALLARPLSPGVIALLMPHAGSDARAAERVLAGISHSGAAVRAAAARVGYVYAMRGMVPALRRALAAEGDRSAAVEMLRALALMGGPNAESDLLPLARKHDAVGALTAAAVGAGMGEPEAAPAKEGEPYTRVLVSSALPPGMLRDVLAITRCKPKAGLNAIGIVDYRRDGRPRRVTMAKQEWPRGCDEAAVAALALSLAPFGLATSDLPARKTVVLIPMDEGSLDCADLPEPSAIERLPEPGVKASITEPKKVRHVNPYYPPAARASGRQGVVVLEGVIGETGCMRSLTVLRSALAELDVSALRAVGQWRYTPTLLDGKPVSVIMTITVNFRLN